MSKKDHSVRDEYQTHITYLAKDIGCRIHQRPNLAGMMFVEFGYVEGPSINNQIDYLINLHEIGHFFHNHTQGRIHFKPPHNQTEKFYFENGVLKSEAQAWSFALDCCLDKVQDESRRFMWDNCLGSYYQHYLLNSGKKTKLGNGDRHYVEFVYDHPDDYFNSVVKRVQGDLKEYKIKYTGKVK